MFVIDKELLRPGVVYYPRTGPVAFSDEDLEEICRSSKALLASGRHPPIPLEHRDDAKPVKMSHEDALSELTRHNTGWVQDFFRKPDGSFWAKLGVIDPEVAQKIKDGRIKYVSPEITPVLPADGRVHRNVVTHVAITHQPVWAGQKPFHVPPGWLGHDGAVTPKAARLSLLSGTPIRLSMADALPPEGVLEAIRLGYRIPGGKAGTGAWFKGVYYPSHIPQKVLKDADPGDLKDLLRKLNSRHGRKVPRDFAGLLEPGEVKEHPTEVQPVPASHLSLHDDLPPFRRKHPDGEPVLAWEDPSGGRTHVVSGHDLVKRLAAREGATVPTLRVHANSPYEARGAALMSHLAGGSADPEDLAGLFMDGADPKELRAALQEAGCSPHEPCFRKAEYLAGLSENDPDQTMADKPPSEPKQFGEVAGPAEAVAPETLFSYAPGYDAEEHRWQHWLQGHFDDPLERASFAAEHGGRRPATHADFLSRKDAFKKQRFSSGGKPVDYFEMTKPKDEPEGEEKPKGKEKGEEKAEEKAEKKEEGPPKKAPEAPKAAEHKFQAILKKLEKFKVHLDPDKIKTAEELVSELETALHALEGAGAAEGGMDMGGDAGGKPPQLEPEQGSMFMSLKSDNEALKKALLEENARTLSLARCNSDLMFSLIDKDTEGLQQKGQCTKAKRDEWLAKIKEVSGKRQFSLVDPAKDVEMVAVFSEIRMARSLPEGTFLPKKAHVAQAAQADSDYRALLFSNTPPLTNGAAGNGTAALHAEPNPHAVSAEALPDGVPVEAEKKAEFDQTWKSIRMSLGIKD